MTRIISVEGIEEHVSQGEGGYLAVSLGKGDEVEFMLELACLRFGLTPRVEFGSAKTTLFFERARTVKCSDIHRTDGGYLVNLCEADLDDLIKLVLGSYPLKRFHTDHVDIELNAGVGIENRGIVDLVVSVDHHIQGMPAEIARAVLLEGATISEKPHVPEVLRLQRKGAISRPDTDFRVEVEQTPDEFIELCIALLCLAFEQINFLIVEVDGEGASPRQYFLWPNGVVELATDEGARLSVPVSGMKRAINTLLSGYQARFPVSPSIAIEGQFESDNQQLTLVFDTPLEPVSIPRDVGYFFNET